MCTLTIDRRSERVLVTMNRDERWTRAPETPPGLHPAKGGGRAWIAPADGERGGTWIGANDAGVVACLLNAYAPGDLDLVGRPDIPSRGEIVPAVLEHDWHGAMRYVEHDLHPEHYPSFVLVILGAQASRVIRWTLAGEVEHEAVPDGWSLITSSWWRGADVVAWRRRRFEAWLAEGAPLEGPLPAFNLLDAPDEREHSPFMTRSYAGTRSVTQVQVDRGRSTVEMRYWPRPGDGALDPLRPSATLELAWRDS